MPHTVTEFQDTPNPNAVKCIVNPPVGASPGMGVRSYQSAGAASNDPLASALFGVPEVVGVFINQGWITVTKGAEAHWKTVKAGVTRVLADAP